MKPGKLINALKSYYAKYGLVPDFLHCFTSSKQEFPLKD